MALTDEAVRERLAQVFARQDFFQTCERGDAGAMITILMDHGVTQGWISARTGLPQSTLSNYKRGKNRAKWASSFTKLADGIDMPLPLREALGLSGEHSRTSSALCWWQESQPIPSICNYWQRQ